MGACTVSRLLGTLALVSFAIAVMASVSNRAIAATETPSADTPTTSCPHQLDKDGKRLWKPSDSDLHLILARHFGYWHQSNTNLDLQNADDASLKNAYLDRTFPDWRKEARKNPERANLCNADLPGANLSGAQVGGANLSGAQVGRANLSGARLESANLSGARLESANLAGAWLGWANLSGAWLSGADLSGAGLFWADLSGAVCGGQTCPVRSWWARR